MKANIIGERISLANEALFELGASRFLGTIWEKDEVEYVDSDGVLHQYIPLNEVGDSDGN
jgi:hypothetical protein|tara:strand:- start:18004 stop:18183 length:180 start_codon:yes stop_codon:yes gene_type:complete